MRMGLGIGGAVDGSPVAGVFGTEMLLHPENIAQPIWNRGVPGDFIAGAGGNLGGEVMAGFIDGGTTPGAHYVAQPIQWSAGAIYEFSMNVSLAVPIYAGIRCTDGAHDFGLIMTPVGTFYATLGNLIAYDVSPDPDGSGWITMKMRFMATAGGNAPLGAQVWLLGGTAFPILPSFDPTTWVSTPNGMGSLYVSKLSLKRIA